MMPFRVSFELSESAPGVTAVHVASDRDKDRTLVSLATVPPYAMYCTVVCNPSGSEPGLADASPIASPILSP